MSAPPRDLASLLAVGVVMGALAAALATAASSGSTSARSRAATRAPSRIVGLGDSEAASFRLNAARGRVDVRSLDKLFAGDVDVSLVVNGEAHPLVIRPSDFHADGKEGVRADVVLAAGGQTLSVGVRIAIDRARDSLVLRAEPARDVEGRASASTTEVALRADVATEGAPLFVDGVGDVADVADVEGERVVVAYPGHPLGFASSSGPLAVRYAGDGGALRASVTSAFATGAGSTDLRLVLGATGGAIWRALYGATGVDTARVRGRVTGAPDGGHARIFGLDDAGVVRVRAPASEDGTFDLFAPRDVVSFYAALDGGRASGAVRYDAARDAPLLLDIPVGGAVAVTVTDVDTHAKLTARLFFHGIEGTLDPTFGPDYRASGAGPLIDALRGAVTTPLAPGRYRVSASKGIEWSIDARDITVESAEHVDVALSLRHVVPTPGAVGCDLHVHARPSFDTPVTTEDRVLSLVAAGVDFAVPTEHNIIGDYGPALSLLALTPELSWVHGVEVTTYSPRFGHFGVFPYSSGPVPPYRATSIAAILAAARKGDEARVVQVNHPRMGFGIGYFAVKHFAPGAKAKPAGLRTDFDTIEVYNGYDLGAPERVAAVMQDWFALLNRGSAIVATGSSDAHRIQYHWAGYPRTYVAVGADADGPRHPLDTAAIVASIKAGRVTVSSGPVVELTSGAAAVGDTISAEGPNVRARVRVHAAPWVDVTSVDLVVGGRIVRTLAVPSRPTYVGPEEGTLAEAEARTLRIDEVVDLPLPLEGEPAAKTWMCAVARGSRTLDDVLPFMPVRPLGFTNPIWISRRARN